MQAVMIKKYGDASVVEIADVEKPQPQAGEILVKVATTAVNPVDWKVRSGLGEMFGFKLPLILGCEIAGTVAETGADVTAFKSGARVYGFIAAHGCHAEYAIAKPEELSLIPEKMSFDEAAALPVGALTAWQAIFDTARLTAGQTILIIGASGGVGSLAVQLAKAKGAHVIAVASGKNGEYVKSIGADEFIDYKTQNFADSVKDADVVFDLIGGESLRAAYKSVKRGGYVITVVEPPPEDLAQAAGVETSMLAVAPNAAELNEITQLAEDGKLTTHVEKVFKLSEARQALEHSEQSSPRGKIVLHVN